MTMIYLDECGYTGDDLMDSEQPTFVIATHSYSENECADLKRQFFGGVKAPELKHSSLQGRASHQKAIVDFVRFLISNAGRVRVSIAHKQYALTGKLVDFIVEPVMHRDGIDLYKDGANVALATMLFHVLQCAGSTTLKEVLVLFQRLIRTRNPDALAEFRRFLRRPALVSVIEETLDMLRSPAARLQWSDISTLPPRALDLSFTMGLNCMYQWSQAGASPMQIFHDASTNMAKQKDLWDVILAPSAPPALVGYGTNIVSFPIGVESTTFGESKNSLGLQIADVIAGAVCRWGRWLAQAQPTGDSYGAELDGLLRSLPQSLFAWLLWPTENVERRPTGPGIGDPLEYLIERVRDA